jgi:energy-coupling factor transport system permease protein
MDDLLYVPGQGFLYQVDPRAKLLFALSVFLYLALESAPQAMLLALLGLHVLALSCQDTRVRVPVLWKAVAPLVVMVLVLGSLRWRAEDALLAVGPVAITLQSLWRAIGLSARIAGLTLALSLALWTTDPGAAVAGLTRLGVPFELGFAAVMALQQVIVFRRLFYQILEAQQSRGLMLPRRNPFRAARAYVPVLVPLLIHALRSVDNLSLALQSRGFGTARKRTSRRQLRVQGRDWLFLILTWAAIAGLSQV